jgi:hypothetical protein
MNAVSKGRSRGQPKEPLKGSSQYVVVGSWAVGRIENSSLIALRLNDERPFLLKLAEARKIAAALKSEADVLAAATVDRK